MAMESLCLKKENITKNIRNLFKLKKETKKIKDRILRDVKNLFEHKEENYYKLVRVNDIWSNNYIEYDMKEYLNKIKPYLKDIINNLKKCDTCKIQLTIASNFFFP